MVDAAVAVAGSKAKSMAYSSRLDGVGVIDSQSRRGVVAAAAAVVVDAVVSNSIGVESRPWREVQLLREVNSPRLRKLPSPNRWEANRLFVARTDYSSSPRAVEEGKKDWPRAVFGASF